MENYEKEISLRTIYLTFARRFGGILLIFLPIVLASFLVTNFMITKTYQSSASISNTAVISAAQYQYLSLEAKKNTTLTTAATNLKAAGRRHSNGAEIAVSELSSGLSIATLASNSISMSVSFQSADSKITQWALDEIVKVTLANAKESSTAYANFSAGASSAPKKNSKETRYFLIASAAGLVIALGVPFVYEIVADEVYDDKDLKRMGIPGFVVTASKPAKR